MGKQSKRALFKIRNEQHIYVTIPVHEGCRVCSETDILGSERKTKSSERKEVSSERVLKSSERKQSERIIDLIKNKPTISAVEIAMEIDMSSRG